jgi:acyl-coenzyme A thioesterase PaaI-like protein
MARHVREIDMDMSTPIGGTDFVTGRPPHGFGLRFYAQPDGSVAGPIRLDITRQGPPGHAHGGAVIALLDEAMGAAAWYNGHFVVAANLQFNLKKAVPLDTDLIVRGRVDSRDGRKVWTSCEILLPDGQIAVDGTGLFLEAPDLVANFADGDNPFDPLT